MSHRLAQEHGIVEQAIRNDDVTLLLSDNFSCGQRFAVCLHVTYSGGSSVRAFGHQPQDGAALAERQGSRDYLIK